MKFKTMMHLYMLLEQEILKEEGFEKKADERVKHEKSKLDSCWETSEELEFWKASRNRHINRVNELKEMLSDMEETNI